MVAIVVAVGATRSWRASLAGAAGGLLVLVAVIALLGTALQAVPLEPLRFVIGALLLTFGSQWYRKGIERVSRDGWTTGSGVEEVDDAVPEGFDWTGFVLSFKGVTLEGLEVAVIVVAFGAAAGTYGLASYRLVAQIPRRALQLFVGAMLVTFGTFWAGESLGVAWPGNELAL